MAGEKDMAGEFCAVEVEGATHRPVWPSPLFTADATMIHAAFYFSHSHRHRRDVDITEARPIQGETWGDVS